MTLPPGVILAGGRARRMGGGDKGLLVLGDTTVLGHVIARLGPQVSALALNANGDPARLAHLRLPVIADGVPGRPGPLAGVLAAMDWAASLGAGRVVTAAADTPFPPGDLVTRLVAVDAPVVLAETAEGRHPTFGLWDTGLREDLRAALGQGVRKVVAWTDPHGAKTALFGGEPFFNVNTPADLDEARAML